MRCNKQTTGKIKTNRFVPTNRSELVDLLRIKFVSYKLKQGRNLPPHTLADVDVSKMVSLTAIFLELRTLLKSPGCSKCLPNDYFNGISEWKFDKLVFALAMLIGEKNFNQDTSKWRFPRLVFANSMFEGCSRYDGSLNDAGMEEVEDISYMFKNCYRLNQHFFHWKTKSLKKAEGAFSRCFSLNQDFDTWDISKLEDCSAMFEYCISLQDGISTWDLEKKFKDNNFKHTGMLAYCRRNINKHAMGIRWI